MATPFDILGDLDDTERNAYEAALSLDAANENISGSRETADFGVDPLPELPGSPSPVSGDPIPSEVTPDLQEEFPPDPGRLTPRPELPYGEREPHEGYVHVPELDDMEVSRRKAIGRGIRRAPEALKDNFATPEGLLSLIPILGHVLGGEDQRVLGAKRRLVAGKYSDQRSMQEDLARVFTDRNEKQIEALRDSTRMARVADGFAQMIPFWAEMFLTRGLYEKGRAASAQAMGLIGRKELRDKAVGVLNRRLSISKETVDGFKKRTGKRLFEKNLRGIEQDLLLDAAKRNMMTRVITGLAGSGARLAAFQPMVYSDMVRRMSPLIEEGPDGSLRMEERQENFLVELLKSEASVFGELASERFGGPLRTIMGRAFGKTATRAALRESITKLPASSTLSPIIERVRKTGFAQALKGRKRWLDAAMSRFGIHAMPEELAEEYVNGVYAEAFNLHGSKEPPATRLLSALAFNLNTPEGRSQFLDMVVLFSIAPAAMGTVGVLQDTVTPEEYKKNQELLQKVIEGAPIQTKQEFAEAVRMLVSAARAEQDSGRVSRWWAELPGLKQLLIKTKGTTTRPGTIQSLVEDVETGAIMKNANTRARNTLKDQGREPKEITKEEVLEEATRDIIERFARISLVRQTDTKKERDELNKYLEEGKIHLALPEFVPEALPGESEEGALARRKDFVLPVEFQGNLTRALVAKQSDFPHVEQGSTLAKHVLFYTVSEEGTEDPGVQPLTLAEVNLYDMSETGWKELEGHFNLTEVENRNVADFYKRVSKGMKNLPNLHLSPSTARLFRGKHKFAGIARELVDELLSYRVITGNAGEDVYSTPDGETRDQAEDIFESYAKRSSLSKADIDQLMDAVRTQLNKIRKKAEKEGETSDLSTEAILILEEFSKAENDPKKHFELFSKMATREAGYTVVDAKRDIENEAIGQAYDIMQEDLQFKLLMQRLMVRALGDTKQLKVFNNPSANRRILVDDKGNPDKATQEMVQGWVAEAEVVEEKAAVEKDDIPMEHETSPQAIPPAQQPAAQPPRPVKEPPSPDSDAGVGASITPSEEAATPVTFSDMVVHSGGAGGADLVFQEYAMAKGAEVKAHSFEDHKAESNEQFVVHSAEELEEANEHLKRANKTLGRTFPPRNDHTKHLLQRNYFQVRDSSQVVAISRIANGQVEGGTAWATQMGVDMGLEVNVFDMVTNQWFKWDGNKYAPSSRPALHKNFAGVGSRRITDNGKQAIADLFTEAPVAAPAVEEAAVEEAAAPEATVEEPDDIPFTFEGKPSDPNAASPKVSRADTVRRIKGMSGGTTGETTSAAEDLGETTSAAQINAAIENPHLVGFIGEYEYSPEVHARYEEEQNEYEVHPDRGKVREEYQHLNEEELERIRDTSEDDFLYIINPPELDITAARMGERPRRRLKIELRTTDKDGYVEWTRKGTPISEVSLVTDQLQQEGRGEQWYLESTVLSDTPTRKAIDLPDTGAVSRWGGPALRESKFEAGLRDTRPLSDPERRGHGLLDFLRAGLEEGDPLARALVTLKEQYPHGIMHEVNAGTMGKEEAESILSRLLDIADRSTHERHRDIPGAWVIRITDSSGQEEKAYFSGGVVHMPDVDVGPMAEALHNKDRDEAKAIAAERGWTLTTEEFYKSGLKHQYIYEFMEDDPALGKGMMAGLRAIDRGRKPEEGEEWKAETEGSFPLLPTTFDLSKKTPYADFVRSVMEAVKTEYEIGGMDFTGETTSAVRAGEHHDVSVGSRPISDIEGGAGADPRSGFVHDTGVYGERVLKRIMDTFGESTADAAHRRLTDLLENSAELLTEASMSEEGTDDYLSSTLEGEKQQKLQEMAIRAMEELGIEEVKDKRIFLGSFLTHLESMTNPTIRIPTYQKSIKKDRLVFTGSKSPLSVAGLEVDDRSRKEFMRWLREEPEVLFEMHISFMEQINEAARGGDPLYLNAIDYLSVFFSLDREWLEVMDADNAYHDQDMRERYRRAYNYWPKGSEGRELHSTTRHGGTIKSRLLNEQSDSASWVDKTLNSITFGMNEAYKIYQSPSGETVGLGANETRKYKVESPENSLDERDISKIYHEVLVYRLLSVPPRGHPERVRVMAAVKARKVGRGFTSGALTEYMKLNAERANAKIYSRTLTGSGRRKNNYVMHSQFTRTMDDNDREWYLVDTIQPQILPDEEGGRVRRNDFLTTDFDDLQEGDVRNWQIDNFEFDLESETFDIWSGQFSEKEQIAMVTVERLPTLVSLTEMGDELTSEEATRFLKFWDGHVEYYNQQLEKLGAEELHKFMVPIEELQEEVDALRFNYALHSTQLHRELYGEYSDYDSVLAIAKRASTVMTPRSNVNRWIMGRETYRVLLVDDPKVATAIQTRRQAWLGGQIEGELNKLEEEQDKEQLEAWQVDLADIKNPDRTDGFSLGMPDFMEMLQGGVGIFASQVNNPEMSSLNTAKMLHDGVQDEHRHLAKSNWATFNEQFANTYSDGAYAALWDKVAAFNGGKEMGEAIDVIHFTSAAKVHPGEASELYEPGTFNIPDDRVIEESEVQDWALKDLGWVLDLRQPTNPQQESEVVQKATSLMYSPSASRFAQLIQNQRKGERLNTLVKEEEADRGNWFKRMSRGAQNLPFMRHIIGRKDNKGNIISEPTEMPDARTEETWLRTMVPALTRELDNKTSRIQAIEIPGAIPNANLNGMELVYSDGSPVPISEYDQPPEGVHTRLAEIDANVKGAGYRYKSTFALPLYAGEGVEWSVEQEIRTGGLRMAELAEAGHSENTGYNEPTIYLDMYVENEKMFGSDGHIRWDNIENWDIQWWEMRESEEAGKFYIPGELAFLTRIPSEGENSHAMARLNKRIPMEGNFVMTSPDLQIFAGADNDGDTRFIELMPKWGEGPGPEVPRHRTFTTEEIRIRGDKGITESFDGYLTEMMMHWMGVWQDPANFNAIADAIDNDRYDHIIKKHVAMQEAGEPFNTLDRQLEIRTNTVLRESGVNEAAAESGGIRLLTELGIPAYLGTEEENRRIEPMLSRLNLVINYTANRVAERQANPRPVASFFQSIINLMVDHPNLLKVNHLGIDENTQKFATALVFLNANLHSKGEVDKYVETISDFLQGEVAREYSDLMRSAKEIEERSRLTFGVTPEDMVWNFLAEKYDGEKLAEDITQDQVAEYMVLNHLRAYANDIFELTQYLRSASRPPFSVAEYYAYTRTRDKLETRRQLFTGTDPADYANEEDWIEASIKEFNMTPEELDAEVMRRGLDYSKVDTTSPFYENLQITQQGIDQLFLGVEEDDPYTATMYTAWGKRFTELKELDLKPDKELTEAQLVELDRRMRQVLVSQAVYRGMRSMYSYQELDFPKLIESIIGELETAQTENPDNRFLQALTVYIPRSYDSETDDFKDDLAKAEISVTGQVSMTELSMEDIIAYQEAADVSSLNGVAWENLRMRLALYAVQKYGLTHQSHGGSFWPLLMGPQFSRELHGLILEEQQRWLHDVPVLQEQPLEYQEYLGSYIKGNGDADHFDPSILDTYKVSDNLDAFMIDEVNKVLGKSADLPTPKPGVKQNRFFKFLTGGQSTSASIHLAMEDINNRFQSDTAWKLAQIMARNAGDGDDDAGTKKHINNAHISVNAIFDYVTGNHHASDKIRRAKLWLEKYGRREPEGSRVLQFGEQLIEAATKEKYERLEKMQQNLMDTGIDAAYLRQVARDSERYDVFDFEEYTTSAVALKHVEISTTASLMPGQRLHAEFLKGLREEKAAMDRDLQTKIGWERKMKQQFKLGNFKDSDPDLTEDLVFSAIAVAIDKNYAGLEQTEGMTETTIQIVLEGATIFNAVAKNPLYKGKESKETKYIRLMEDPLTGEQIDPISAKEIRDRFGAGAFDEWVIEMKAAFEVQRVEASSRGQGLGDRVGVEDYIRKYPNYIYHKYGTKANLARPNRGVIEKSLIRGMAQEALGKESISHKDAAAWLAENPGQLEVLGQRATEEFQKQTAEFDANVEELIKDGDYRAREDAGPAYSRTYDSYEEAAEATGRLPQSLNGANLLLLWQTTVSEAIRNQHYFSSASLTQNFDGQSMMIPVKTKDQAEESSVSAISLRQAQGVLQNVISTAKSLDPSNRQKYVLKRGLDPWDQIRDILESGDFKAKLQDAGYKSVELKGYSFSHVWVREGATEKLLKHITSRGFEDIRIPLVRNIMQGIKIFNNFTKQMLLGVSFFHHWALGESYIGVYGLNLKKTLRGASGLWKTWRDVVRDPHSIEDPQLRQQAINLKQEWVRAGLTVAGKPPDYTLNQLDSFLEKMIKLAGTGNIPLISKGAQIPWRAILWLKKKADAFLWEGLHPTLKLDAAQFVLSEVQSDPAYAGVPPEQLRSDISQYINDAFGGQEWERYLWANPFARDIMNTFMFAPDWTISALNVAGFPEVVSGMTQFKHPLFGKPTNTGLAVNQKMKAYWPAFISIVLVGLPSALQAAIYELWGDPDEDDHRFPHQNPGREMYIDLTPIVRALGIQYGQTGKGRRVYMRWGKQAYEIKRWLTDFSHSITGKSSSTVKVIMEQLIGKKAPGWPVPWADSKDATFWMVDKSFWDSRAGHMASKFVPMSILTQIQGRPTTFFASTKLGLSQFEAVDKLHELLFTYVDSEVTEYQRHYPDAKKAMESMGKTILDAAESNGYSRKRTLSLAKGKVVTHYRQLAWRELDRKRGPRDEELKKISNSLKRIDSGFKGMTASRKIRKKERGLVTDQEDWETWRRVWRGEEE